MRTSGLVSGNFLDRLAILQRRQLKLMGHSSFWMFSHLRDGFSVRAHFAAAPEKERLGAGQRLCGWDFPDRVSERHVSEKTGHLPWDYSHARLNVKGVIRLDYAPVWFLTGLLYEKLLNKFMAS